MSYRKLHPIALLFVLAVASCIDYEDPLRPDGAVVTADSNPMQVSFDAHESVPTVDPFMPRLVIAFVVRGALTPQSPITVWLEGVAMAPITGGEVVVTLPTIAGMEYAGPDKRPRFPPRDRLPVVARWQLPAMQPGDDWKESVQIGILPKGCYHIDIHAVTDALPEHRGAYIVDDIVEEAWVFVMGGGGFITPTFDASVFPNRIAPLPGPFRPRYPGGSTSQVAADARVSYSNGNRIYVEVGYVYRGRTYPAKDAYISANIVNDGGFDDSWYGSESHYVPASGMVAFSCPGNGRKLEGSVTLPSNAHVASGTFNGYWDAYQSECGDTIQVTGTRYTYMPWSNLRFVIPRIRSRLGSAGGRSQMAWTVNPTASRSSYDPANDEIDFGRTYYKKWTAAHEYGHALQGEKYGGTWRAESACYANTREIWGETGYKCALLEGFADYIGNIGWEGDGDVGPLEHRGGEGSVPGRVEGNVAALIWDLIDSARDGNDRTSYSASYVFDVFGTCRVERANSWVKRNNTTDYVWCLENRVNEDVHDDHFPGITAPTDVSEGASKPGSWDADDIRKTWVQNVGR